MTSPDDQMGPRSGLTLFEALIALSIIAMMAGVVVAGRGTPSAALELNAVISDLTADAFDVRGRAIVEGQRLVWEPEVSTCGGDPVVTNFHPDGTADAIRVCIERENVRKELRLDPLTGILIEVPE